MSSGEKNGKRRKAPRKKLTQRLILMSVLQGLLLVIALSSILSVSVHLLLSTYEQLNDVQTMISQERTGTTETLPEQPETIDLSEFDRERVNREAGPLRLMAVIMYSSLALLFLIRALTTREDWKHNRPRYGIGFALFAASACVFLLAGPDRACGPAAIFHTAALITDHAFSIVKEHKTRNVVSRSVFILLTLVALSTWLFSAEAGLLFVVILTIPRIFYYIAKIAFARVKLDVLRKILKKTYAAEILLGMLLLIISFSIVLPQLEPGIQTFGNALWYCFAIVTTIGFGDFTAVTIPGRIISVILGVYGIVVVALITSIIVNFYSETKNSEDDEDEDREDVDGEEEKGAEEEENEKGNGVEPGKETVR